jgi:hypothetical protein
MADAPGVESSVMWRPEHPVTEGAIMTLWPATLRPDPSIDFWGDLDGDVLRLLADRPEGLSPVEISHRLGVSEDGVRSILTMLAHEGRIRMLGGTANGTHA